MENNITTEIVEATVTEATPKATVKKATAAKKTPVAKKATVAKKAVTAKKATATKKVTTKKVAAKKVVAPKTVTMSETTSEIKGIVNATVKDINKKVDFSKNVNNVKKSVKSLNEQIVASTSVIYGEVKEMNKEIAEIAVKNTKEMVANFDMNQEVAKIKTTATELNQKAVLKVKEMNAKVTAKAEEIKSTTTNLAMAMVDNININERLATVKDVVKNSNKYALKATDNAIENAEKNASEWQKLAEKAVKKSFKLASKQQELVFETLGEVKNQVVLTRNNVRRLFSSKEA